MRQGINKSVSVYTYLVCGWLCWTPCIYAAIDIELRPILQSAEINDIINVRLFVVSDSGSPQSIAAMDIVLVWDASRLKLTGYTDPCDESPCPDNTYAWLQSWFPEDDSLDGLNDDCGDGVFCNSILCKTGCPEGATCDQFSGFCKTTKLPFNDGDAKYVAWSNIGGGENSAQATPEGLWVTSFQFQVISTGTAEVRVVDTLGTFSTTRIADGDEPGILVTGLIGLPAEIVIGGCVPPVVEAVGSRYLAITPGPSNDLVALRVSGTSIDFSINCISLFVQPDGTLGEEAVAQLPETWNTIFVGDQHIIPDSVYEVQSDCSAIFPGLVSQSIPVSTKVWADVTEDGEIDFSDVLLIIDGTDGNFRDGATLQSLDLFPCIPDRVINEDDISVVKDAMIFLPFPCRAPCQLHFPLEDWSGFLTCMEGPGSRPPVQCALFDMNYDNIVDLLDVSAFMNHP